MDPVVISHRTVAELAAESNLSDLFAEYALESATPGLGTPVPQIDTYQRMEDAGVLYALAAHVDDRLVGFLLLLVSALPHYGQTVATSESFFVARAARQGGTGLKLLRAAEQCARDHGAVGMFVSAPVLSRLDGILPRLGYTHTNQTFFRKL